MPELSILRKRKQASHFIEQLHGAVKQPSSFTAQDLNLTAREGEVWKLREANYSFKEIAAQLFISLNTVKKHLKNVYVKQRQLLEKNVVELDMVLIPGGTFQMGSPDDEPERREDEGPQHEVRIPSFFMGRYLVTQAQWRFVAQLEQVNRQLDLEPSHFKGDDRPVEQVSWYDAIEFCDRLKHHTGRAYRLPTEAEWEYACRAGTQTPFYFGKTLTTDLANYDGTHTYNDGFIGEFRQETTPVDYFEIANAFGLSDMHGNVCEWCQDHWHSSYEGAPIDGSAWIEDKDDSRRVLRGGSWDDDPRRCRSASRDYSSPDGLHNLGFRVVCSAPRTL